MEEDKSQKKPSTKPEKSKVLMAFNVFVDVHQQFRQIAFQAQMSISELLRKALSDFENTRFSMEALEASKLFCGEIRKKTAPTTFNVSPIDKERIHILAQRHHIKATDVVRCIMYEVVKNKSGNIKEEQIIKPENKKRLDLEFPSDVYQIVHAHTLQEFTNLSEFVRVNFDKFTADDYIKYAAKVDDAKINKTLYRTSLSIYPQLEADIIIMAKEINIWLGKTDRKRKVKKSDILGAFLYFARDRIISEKNKSK